MISSVQARYEFQQFCVDKWDAAIRNIKIGIEKIIVWAKQFFTFIGVIRTPIYQLEPRQSQFIEQYKLHPEHYRQPIVNAAVDQEAIPVNKTEPLAIPLKKHDDYLEGMKHFVHEFAQILSKCLYQKYSQKLLDLCKQVPPNIPDKVRQAVYWVYGLDDQLKKPLFKKIRENRCASRWTPEMKEFLTWTKGKDSGDLYLKLLQELPTKVQVKELPKGQMIEDYTSQVLGTLFNPESTSMADVYRNHALEPHILGNVFEAAVVALFDHKVNTVLARFTECIQNNLPEILRDLMMDNSVKIADHMANRIADLIQNIGDEQPGVGNPNYTKMFDAAMAKINDQAIAFLNAEAKTKSSVVDSKFLSYFREADICHDMIRGKILPVGNNQTISLEEYHKKLDNAIYSVITENFLELLLPSTEKTVDGRLFQVHGTHGIIENLTLPPVFFELVNDVKKIAFEITTPETTELTGKIMEPMESLFEKFLLANVQGMIFNATRTALSNMIRLLSDKDALDAYVGEKILPVVNYRLICTLTSETIRHYMTDFAPYFKALATEINRQEAMDKLLKFLYEKVKKSLGQFDLAKELPFEQFQPAVQYLVDDIDTMLAYEKAAPTRKHIMETPEVVSLMKSYYTNYYKADNPLYAQLVMNAVFKIGNFGKLTETLLGISSLQKLISTAIVTSMKRVRTSPRQIVMSCIKIAQKQFGSEEAIMKVLSGRKSTEPEANRKNIKDQIDKASRLLYDLVSSNISRSITGGHLVAVSVLGKDATHLRAVMETCYHKFFGNPILAQNLLYQIQDVIVGTFRESSIRAKLKAE